MKNFYIFVGLLKSILIITKKNHQKLTSGSLTSTSLNQSESKPEIQ